MSASIGGAYLDDQIFDFGRWTLICCCSAGSGRSPKQGASLVHLPIKRTRVWSTLAFNHLTLRFNPLDPRQPAAWAAKASGSAKAIFSLAIQRAQRRR